MASKDDLVAAFKKLETSMNAASPDREELASLVSEIHGILAQAGTSSCSFDEKKLLETAAVAVLEPALTELLKLRLMKHVAVPLVCSRVVDLNTTACMLVAGELKEIMEAAALAALTAVLETRGALLIATGHIADSADWLEKVCRKYPTKRALQQSKWATVEALLEGALTAEVEKAVWTVWGDGSELRKKVEVFGLRPGVADQIVDSGFQSIEAMKESDLEAIQHGQNDGVKAKLRRMWAAESKDGRAESESVAKKREELRTKTKEAENLVSEMMNDVSKARASTDSEVSRDLDNTLSSLGMKEWSSSVGRVEDPAEMTSRLKKLGNVLERAGAALALAGTTGNYESDELISRASAGLALYAVSFGYSRSELGKKAPRPLLRMPEYCPLLSPSMDSEMKASVFTSVESANSYRASITSSGETITAKLKASGWGFHANASHSMGKRDVSHEKEETVRRSTTAVSVDYGVVPVKSFRISQEQMKLSSEAEKAVLAVTTLAEARRFLENFGSHVPCGTQHLGGIFWKIVEIRTEDEVESQELKKALARVSNTSVGISAPVKGVDVTAAGEVHKSNSSGNATGFIYQNRSYTATTRIECTGPNVSDYDLFSQVLAVNNTSWFLIDRGEPNALVAVWDLLSPLDSSKGKAIVQIQKLLRAAWIETAKDLAFLPEVQYLLYRAEIYERVHATSLELKLSDKEQSHLQVSKKVNEVGSISVEKADPQLIRGAVEGAFNAMFVFDYWFGTFVVAEYMRDGAFREFLSSLASRAAMPNVQPALHYLCTVLDTQMKAKLLCAVPSVQLDSNLETVLDNIRSKAIVPLAADMEQHIWQPPLVPLSDLPATVMDIANAVMQSAPNDSTLLKERVGSVLSLNLWRRSESKSSSLRDSLVEVASKFYCTQDGFSFPLTRESLLVLVAEMEQVVRPPPKIEVVLPEDLSRFTFDVDALQSDGLPYSYVRVDRRTPDGIQDLQSCILYALIHRLDVGSLLYPNRKSTLSNESARNEPQSELRGPRRGRAARLSPGVGGTEQPKHESVFNAAMLLLLSLDASARSEVIRLLLERRFIVPFIFPTSSAKENAPFHCDLTSLGLITTAISHDGEDIVRANLVTDTAHMHVAVLSNREKEKSACADWIEAVFHVQSFHAVDCKNKRALSETETAAEIGWGFVKDTETGAYVPVVLLHVVGDYRPLRHFIAMFADAVVLDADSSDGTARCDVKLQHGALVKWSHADPDEETVVESGQEDPVFVVSLRCKYTESIRRITEFLLGELEDSQGRQERAPLNRMQPNEVYMAQAPRFDFGALEAKTSFADLRSKFELQNLFRQESQVVIASQRESDPMEGRRQQTMIATFQRQRQEVAPSVDRHDVIMLFKDMLRIRAAPSRVISLLDLERWLTKQCEEQSVSARQVYREARNAWQKDRSVARREKMMTKLHDWDMKTVTMEHLWRELSHLYVADRTNRGYLANLAARHLLDGFSLELMDGDAGMMNLQWIQGVLKELHRMLGSARLLVLSIMGVQSSGKSTLLNYMFGVRLRASVSRCTRGVSIQLMRCEGRKEYEYVLLMDTEGIRAPEYNNTEDSIWRDNRMATFAILPADATIILTKGEETATINEILPIVLSAYLESETAQKNGGQFPSKLLFVFNQIDMTEKSKLENVVDTLTRELNENARKVEEIRHGNHLEESEQRAPAASTQFFHDLNVDIANEETSDIWVLGTIKAEPSPPKDAPLPDYGMRLVKLREHIHRRVCVGQSWRGRNVEEFSEYLAMVWKCIETSNFHFNFVAAFERINYDKLVHKINQCKQELTKHYNDAFDGISKEIHPSTDKRSNSPVLASEPSETFVNRLAEGMMAHLEKLEADVDSVLKEERFSKWSTDQRNAWELYKSDQAAHWRRLVHDLVNVFFKYEAIVEGYKKKLRERANDEFRNSDFKRFSSQQRQEQFDKLFDKLAAEVDKEHPPFHNQVRARVDQVFARDRELSWVFKEKAWWSATGKSWFPQSFSDRKKQQRYARSINETVRRTLDGETKYSDGIVTKCIQLTKHALVDAEREMQVSEDMKRGVYRDIRELIREVLVEKQFQFDSENSVSARFQTCRPQMNTYFENLSKGWKGMDLLKASVRDWLSSNMEKSFKEELTAIVGTNLKTKRWVESADVMQALVDDSLMQYLKGGAVGMAFMQISDPRCHTEEVVSQQIVGEVDRCITEKCEAFKAALKQSIVEAAKAAACVEKDRAMTFLASLKSQIGGYLRPSATGSPNSLLTTMPDAGDTNFNCDEQTADVFDPQNKEFVCADMLSDIDAMTVQGVDVTQDILAYLNVRAHGASNGVMPRCGEPCPLCKSPCTRDMGHVAKEEEKRHDSYHQPSGLAGVYDVKNSELVPGSCNFMAKNGWRFQRSDVWHNYSDFDKVFPNWCFPVEKEPLLLREYIFCNYQDELASYHSLNKCTNMPPSYSHDESVIKEHINRLLS